MRCNNRKILEIIHFACEPRREALNYIISSTRDLRKRYKKRAEKEKQRVEKRSLPVWMEGNGV